MSKKFAWSYSALTGYETCPKQYYHLKVAKDIQEAPSAAMLEGSNTHTALEQRVRDGKPLPLNLRKHEKLCSRFANAKGEVLVERKLALNEKLEETEYFARDVWVRGVFDVALLSSDTLRIYDYKTGSRKPDNQQLRLFAALGAAVWPQVKKIQTYFLWLKTGETDRADIPVEEVPLIWAEFEPRVEAMVQSKENNYYPARPSGLCRGWCPVKTCPNWEARR
jgi:hypothetical protein